MKRFAYTLSEILITLCIVGVVAALTIPNVITVYQKKAAVAGILETQSILSQAVKMYTAETDEEGAIFFDTTLPIEEFAQKYFLPYLKVAQVCTKMSDGCWRSGNFNGYYDLAGVKCQILYHIVLFLIMVWYLDLIRLMMEILILSLLLLILMVRVPVMLWEKMYFLFICLIILIPKLKLLR